jgi:hypothetical protein
MRHHFRNLILAGTVATIACGGDSSGPTAPSQLSGRDALQSLTRGLTTFDQSSASSADIVSLSVLPLTTSSQTVPVGQITVTVDGSQVQMFAVAQRVVYPSGSCLEQLAGISNLANPGSCTGIPGALSLILWQTSSASQTPDRMIVVLANVGTSHFTSLAGIDSTFLGGGDFPSIAFYAQGTGIWVASGGDITSAVTATTQACPAIPPLFAKSVTCAIGSFAESGGLTFSPVDVGHGAPTGSHTIAISAQTLNGMIQTVTAVVPIGFPTN